MNRTRIVVMTLFLLLTTLVIGVGTAAALATADLAALAEYAPADAPVFAAVRTDEDFIATLDTLAARLAAAFPDDFPPDFSLSALLDDPTQTPLGSINQAFRPWLGGTAAGFLPTNDLMALGGNPEFILVFSVTDRPAAADFLEAVYAEDISGGTLTLEEADGITRYINGDGGTTVLLAESALLISTLAPFTGDVEAAVLPGEDAPSLTDTSAFNETLAALPASDYNALVYADLGDLLAQALPLVSMQFGAEVSEAIGLDTLAERFGQQAIGFTLLDDRALTMDVAAVGGLFSGLPDSPALDPDFAQRVPAEMSLVILGTDLGGQIRFLLDSLEDLSPVVQQLSQTRLADTPGSDLITLSTLLTALRLNYQGVVGQPLDEALANASGNFALFLGFDLLERSDNSGLAVRPGFVMQTASAGDAQLFVDALGRQTTQTFSRATYENGVLTLPGNFIFQATENADLPLLLDAQVAVQADLLAAGDSASVQFALNPSDEGTAGSAYYAFERGLFVPEAETAWLVNFAALRELVSLLEMSPMMDETLGSPDDVADLKTLLALFDSAAISAGIDAAATFRARFTLTLSAQ